MDCAILKILRSNLLKTSFFCSMLVVSMGCNASDSVGSVRGIQSLDHHEQAASASKSPAPSEEKRSYKTAALVYQGDATAYGDAEAISDILDSHHLTYDVVNSDELNSLSQEDLNQYGMIIWPGGYAGVMSDSLDQSTRDRIRKAVNEAGVGYVGFCAGAFMAVTPDTSWGFSIVTAPVLDYYHLEDEGTEYAIVPVKLYDGSERSLLWWGGPYLPEYPQGVIARYSDTKQPAIVETWAGKGLMVISGPHPESPENWRTKLGLDDPDGLDQDIAWKMFDAALNRKPMPTLN